jgi:tetratricopeptide (TPR) repeat protein
MLPSGSLPYEGRPLDYLINGVGWCDYMSRVFNCLLAAEGIPSRYAMLMDEQCSLSNHTLNEVLIDGKWAAFDPLTGVIFRDRPGRYLSLEELSDNPRLIAENARLLASEKIKGITSDYYRDKFPLSCPPRRSEPGTQDLTVFDYLTMGYIRLFGRIFINPMQDMYLAIKTKGMPQDYKIFYLARNYSLYYRSGPAKRYYNLLIEKYPSSPYAEDGIFFLGLLYIGQEHGYQNGIEILEGLLSRYPDSRWAAYVNLYLGLAYDGLGDSARADAHYAKAPDSKLDTEVIYRLIRRPQESKS